MTSTALVSLSSKLAARYGMENDSDVVATLKQTAFKTKESVSDAQLAALLVIANEYGLNPFTREIYAYPDAHKGIVPVVGVDGWSRIMNEHPMMDGIEFSLDSTVGNESMTATIYRKDRSHPTVVTEYLEECRRPTDPWKNMPRRMLRHKAQIQATRIAFGFAAFDEEEALEAAGRTTIDATTGEIVPDKKGPARKSAAKTPLVDEVEKTQDAAATGGPSPAAATSSPTPASTTTTTSRGVAITANQIAYLRNKLKSANVAEQTICDRFSIQAIETLSAEQFDLVKSELLALG